MGRLYKKYLVIKTVVSFSVSQGILIVQVRALFEFRNIPHRFISVPLCSGQSELASICLFVQFNNQLDV